MKSFRKTAEMGVRMSKAYRAKLRRAAEIETRRRNKVVSSTDVLLEQAEPGIDRIIAEAEKKAAA